MYQEAKKSFIAKFRILSRSHGGYSVFEDFLTLSVAAIHNGAVFSQELEDEYMALVKKYTATEIGQFSELLVEVCRALKDNYSDFLGDVFMSLDLGNGNMGQFFTPYHIGVLMARLSLQRPVKLPECGYLAFSEPTAGAGGLIIAQAEIMAEAGLDVSNSMFVQAIDLSKTAAKMAFLQFSILGIPAEVIHGNSLSLEVFRVYRTPAFYRNGWIAKLGIDPASIGLEESVDATKTVQPTFVSELDEPEEEIAA